MKQTYWPHHYMPACPCDQCQETLTKAQEQALSEMEQREYTEKVVRLVRADEAPLGAFLMHPYTNECYGRITRLCKNPHFGWVGFELNDTDSFNGWHKPADMVRIA